jgi:hypothetical protein
VPTLDIEPFASAPEYDQKFIRNRLMGSYPNWPRQSLAILACMAWPHDVYARRAWRDAHQPGAEEQLDTLMKAISRKAPAWGRVADIFHLYYDITAGRHLKRRGGASIGKAITLAETNTRRRGSGHAQLWKLWTQYKDVAHLITAAVVVSAQARTMNQHGPFVRSLRQLTPHHMVLMLPELVVSVAMSFERFGRSYTPYGRRETALDPKTVWKIPQLNLQPVLPPIRRIRPQDLHVLRTRRAGNRGRWKTPS